MAKSKHVLTADDLSFASEVLDAEGPVLVDFTARWCPPCKALEPVLDGIADENVGRIKVVAVDIDDAPITANRYGVRGAPTVIAFRDGERRAQHVGDLEGEAARAPGRRLTLSAAPSPRTRAARRSRAARPTRGGTWRA